MMREETKATNASTEETRNKAGRFHCSGSCLATALSYPIAMRVPSFKRVMSISISTGRAKKCGHSLSGKSGFVSQLSGMYLIGSKANTAMKKKINSCRVAAIL